MKSEEIAIRQRLGIPEAARQALIFSESSHWDPNWLLTSEEYYRLRVRCVIDQALRALTLEPRRIYSIEGLFFLKMYWDRRPERRDAIRAFVNGGRLRFTGSGFTSPDTILPESEALLRDFLLGQEWLRRNGMEQEPRLVYLPDSFGHSPGLPALCSAIGFGYAVVTRIDGMYFFGSDLRGPKNYPIPGSTAALLQQTHKTLDFIWRAPTGEETLCHWNAFTYGQGDTLDMIGPAKTMGLRIGFPWRSEAHIARRIDGYVRQLAPLSKTPYLLCPIGFDFNGPVPALTSLVARYNERQFPQTGVYAVNAGMDDYMDLVARRREELPVLEIDPNPYFMGFYSARPEMKQRCKRLTQKLMQAEKWMAAPSASTIPTETLNALAAAWETAAVSNHHDYITGTAPDRVWKKEQRPWLVTAEASADGALADLRRHLTQPAQGGPSLPKWSVSAGKLRVENRYFMLEMDEGQGGCITRWTDSASGREWLAGLGNEPVLYEDSGGLWRMGNEFRGGTFAEIEAARHGRACIRARQEQGVLIVEVDSRLDNNTVRRTIWLRDDSPFLRMRIAARLGRRRCLTLRFATVTRPEALLMDVPGGVVRRPLEKIFRPTFWAAKSFAHLPSVQDPAGWAVLFFAPACISANAGGGFEIMALRNAPRERAFGFLPLPAHPAKGTSDGEQAVDYAIGPTVAGDWRENRLFLLPERIFHPAWIDSLAPDWGLAADSPAVTDNDLVIVGAIKPADRGEGLIVRLVSYSAVPVEITVACHGRMVADAWRCDARERDQEKLTVAEGKVTLVVRKHLETVRLHTGQNEVENLR